MSGAPWFSARSTRSLLPLWLRLPWVYWGRFSGREVLSLNRGSEPGPRLLPRLRVRGRGGGRELLWRRRPRRVLLVLPQPLKSRGPVLVDSPVRVGGLPRLLGSPWRAEQGVGWSGVGPKGRGGGTTRSVEGGSYPLDGDRVFPELKSKSLGLGTPPPMTDIYVKVPSRPEGVGVRRDTQGLVLESATPVAHVTSPTTPRHYRTPRVEGAHRRAGKERTCRQ